MNIDKDGLAPCPLCAAQMLLERFVDWESQPLNVQHIVHLTPTTCPLAGVQIEASTEAIAAWNRRALPNTGDELVARLRQVPRHEGHSYPVEGAIRVVPYGNMLNDAADAIASLTARAQAAEASLASAREALEPLETRAEKWNLNTDQARVSVPLRELRAIVRALKEVR